MEYLGFASFPFSAPESSTAHAIFLDPDTLPPAGYPEQQGAGCCDSGDTAVHEAGHYFGLFHTFSHENYPWGSCAGANQQLTGDMVCDTPAQSLATESNVWCSNPDDSCSIDNEYTFISAVVEGGSSSGSKSTHDPNWSFMDYSADKCMTRFSPGQAARLREQIELYKPKASAIWEATTAANPNPTSPSCARTAVGVAVLASCTDMVCPSDDFTCVSDDACVPKQELCDCIPNCAVGSDESAEHAGCDEDLCSKLCESTEWECADGLQCKIQGLAQDSSLPPPLTPCFWFSFPYSFIIILASAFYSCLHMLYICTSVFIYRSIYCNCDHDSLCSTAVCLIANHNRSSNHAEH